MRQFLLLFFIITFYCGFGQSIRGTITETNQPVAFAIVLLHLAKDSTLVKFTYTDDSGSFSFDNINNGEYFLKATLVGLDDYVSQIFTLKNTNTDMGIISMAAFANNLSEVTITAKKPLIGS